MSEHCDALRDLVPFVHFKKHEKNLSTLLKVTRLSLFEICVLQICEMFVYKHTETIEYLRSSLLFKKTTSFKGE